MKETGESAAEPLLVFLNKMKIEKNHEQPDSLDSSSDPQYFQGAIQFSYTEKH